MKKGKSVCPECGCKEFITAPNRYDCLNFTDGKFKVIKSEFTDDKETIFCRECGCRINEAESLKKKKILLI